MFAGSDKDEAKNILFYTFLGIGAVGVFLFLFLGKEANEVERRRVADGDIESDIVKPSKSTRDLVRTSIDQISHMLVLLFKDKRMMLLVPLMYFSGNPHTPK